MDEKKTAMESIMDFAKKYPFYAMSIVGIIGKTIVESVAYISAACSHSDLHIEE